MPRHRPDADGTYPHDGGRWVRIKTLGSAEKNEGAPGQKAAEELVGFSLEGFINKGFYCYDVDVGSTLGPTCYAVYLHDWTWHVIRSAKPEAVKDLRDRRKANVLSAQRWINDLNERIEATNAQQNPIEKKRMEEDLEFALARLEQTEKALKALTDFGL